MKREEGEMRELLLMENKHRWLPQLLRTPNALAVRGMASYSWAIEKILEVTSRQSLRMNGG